MTSLADLDAAPVTASYRQRWRTRWQLLRVHHSDTLAEAQARGFTVDIARRAAAHSVRGETRALMSELLTRASLPALTAFMADGQRWGQSGEHLMDHSEAVVQLIDHAYPVPTWTALEGVDPTRAADEAFWTGWVDAWHDEFDAAAARATGPSGAQPEDSTLRRWAPWLASAAAIVSATTVVVAATRR